MENKIYNILYQTTSVAYFLATVSEEYKTKAGQALEKHLVDSDSLKGKRLGFRIINIIDTGIKADSPRVLNSHVVLNRNGELD